MPNATILTEQDKAEIVSSYLTGTGLKKLGAKYHCDYNLIKDIIIASGNNLPIPRQKITQQLEDQVVKLYLEEIWGGNRIATKLGISHDAVNNILHRRGVEIRDMSKRFRKYKVVEDYFDVIDTEEKAYYLGWIAADGNINQALGTLCVNLSSKDRELLEKFSKVILIDDPLSHISDYIFTDPKNNKIFNRSRLSISNRPLCAGLIKNGCGPAKSFTLDFPDWLDDDLLRPYLKGYTDGDGSIFFDKKHNAINYSLISSDHFINAFSSRIAKILNINVAIERNKKSIGMSMGNINGNMQVIKFLNWLYQNSTIHLTRKYNRYLDGIRLLEYCNRYKTEKAVRLDPSIRGEFEYIHSGNENDFYHIPNPINNSIALEVEENTKHTDKIDKINYAHNAITDEVKTKMIERYLSSVGGETLAKEFGSKAQIITKIVREAGYEIRGSVKKLSEADKDEIVKLYESGLGCVRIAEKFPVGPVVINKLLKKRGIIIRKNNQCHNADKI